MREDILAQIQEEPQTIKVRELRRLWAMSLILLLLICAVQEGICADTLSLNEYGIGIHLCLQVPALIFRFIMPGNLIVLTIHEVLNMAATSLAMVYTAIAMILFYYDIRLRKEGFDLRTMAENL